MNIRLQPAHPLRLLGLFSAALAALTLLFACTSNEPIRIGFLGGVTGRVADLGIGGRNGALLAIEQRNAAGGINGRKIELIVEDDQQNPALAGQAMQHLIDQSVVAVVGPMTSAMAMAVVPLANNAHLLMVSPTVTTTELSGIDDYFFRVIDSTTEYARKSARYHASTIGTRRITVVTDQNNAAYTASWLNDYRKTFEDAGGQVLQVIPFKSSDSVQFWELAKRLLQPQPDGVLMLANSVDTAMIAQQIRKINAKVHISASEWSATERLIELGGKAVEGMTIAQFVDRASQLPSYLTFRQAYLARFKREPGFAGLTGYDATNVMLDGLSGQAPQQTLKQAILARKEFDGAQSSIRFDSFGDASRATFLTSVRDGKFVRVK